MCCLSVEEAIKCTRDTSLDKGRSCMCEGKALLFMCLRFLNNYRNFTLNFH